MEVNNERHARRESVLCSAQQPDKSTGRCILYCGHQGPHQTFVAEWQEGAANSRRRQTRFTMQRTPPFVHVALNGSAGKRRALSPSFSGIGTEDSPSRRPRFLRAQNFR